MPPVVAIYSSTELGGAFHQGEILTGLQQLVADPQSIGAEGDPDVLIVTQPYVVIVTQECDLDSDYRARSGGGTRPQRKLLSGVLVCEAEEAEIAERNTTEGAVWNHIRTNQHIRYHFLQAVAAQQDALGRSLPTLVVDFKHYFTIPVDELYERLNHGLERRTRLANEYMTHFADRFAYFQGRVAIPVPHQYE